MRNLLVLPLDLASKVYIRQKAPRGEKEAGENGLPCSSVSPCSFHREGDSTVTSIHSLACHPQALQKKRAWGRKRKKENSYIFIGERVAAQKALSPYLRPQIVTGTRGQVKVMSADGRLGKGIEAMCHICTTRLVCYL